MKAFHTSPLWLRMKSSTHEKLKLVRITPFKSFQSPEYNWEKRMDSLKKNWESLRELIFNFPSVYSRVVYVRPVVFHLCRGKV